MIQFYAPDIREKNVLSPEESVHCARVLRKKEGDVIYLTDGEGRRYECEILKSSTKGVEFKILGDLLVPKEWSFNVTLVVAPTKNHDRMAWLVEKATEVGVDKIIFISCGNSERPRLNIERLKRNAISAMNQSLKTRIPKIEGVLNLNDFLKSDIRGQKFFGYCDSEIERLNLSKEIKEGEDVVILIGPEGDFREEEVKTLMNAGFKPTIFINTRLRTETAALFGLQTVHIVNEMK